MAAPIASIWRRTLAAAVILAGTTGVFSTGAVAAPATPACRHPVLVLSAMPLELNPLVAKATLDPARTVHVNGRTFYVGQLAGNDVVLALTGIGPVNASETANAAMSYFACPFRALLFSGVAGSQAFIGDVVVPQRWTMDNGNTWIGADAAMLATAARLQRPGAVALSQNVPVGDAACLCGGVGAATPVQVPHTSQVLVGSSGETTDPFGGHAVPCVWAGGDIAGCEPCVLSGNPAQDTANFAANAPSLADPGFLTALLQPPAQTTSTMAANDEETAAVAREAQRYGVPFLGIRSVSDGQGDPLHLPGFPSQFLVYRQLAGNNAAAVTIAFLQTWTAGGRPT